jgi:putative ABC transport system permease protein
MSINAVEPTFLRLGGYKMSKGKSISDDDLEGIIINSSVAQVFGKNIDEVLGQEISFTFFVPESSESSNMQDKFKKIESQRKYRIAGVIDSEENVAFIHAKTLEFLGIEKFNTLKVRCSNESIMKTIRDRVIEMGLLVSSLSDIVEQANQVFSVIQIVLMLFGVVALIVSAIGMFNTMTIALLERTEEIGIMKSIGASNAAVSLMFVTEATVMGFLGGLGGVVIGYIGGEVFNISINLVAKRFGGESVDLFYSPPEFVLGIIIFAAVVGFFTGVVPARRASSIDPLDALRYK